MCGCCVAGEMQMSGCRLLRHWVQSGRKQVRLEMAAPQPAPVAAQAERGEGRVGMERKAVAELQPARRGRPGGDQLRWTHLR